MVTTYVPAVTAPHPSVLPAGHGGQAWQERHFLPAGSKWDLVMLHAMGSVGHMGLHCVPLLGVRALKAVIGRLAEP